MIARFFMPSPDYEPLVFRYIAIRSERRNEDYLDRFIPDGRVAVVFNFQGQAFASGDQAGLLPLPRCFIVRPTSQSLYVRVMAPVDSLVVACQASAFSRCLKLSLDRIPDAWDQHGLSRELDALFEALKPGRDVEDRIHRLEAGLQERFFREPYKPDGIDEAYARIMSGGYRDRLSDLWTNTAMNDRTFRRVFLKRVGISAKALSRVVRVHRLWDQMMTGQTDFFDLVVKEGFHDQAHLIKDFKKIVGEPPRAFVSRDLSQVKLISGKVP